MHDTGPHSLGDLGDAIVEDIRQRRDLLRPRISSRGRVLAGPFGGGPQTELERFLSRGRLDRLDAVAERDVGDLVGQERRELVLVPGAAEGLSRLIISPE